MLQSVQFIERASTDDPININAIISAYANNYRAHERGTKRVVALAMMKEDIVFIFKTDDDC